MQPSSFPSTSFWRDCLFGVYSYFLSNRVIDHKCIGLYRDSLVSLLIYISAFVPVTYCFDDSHSVVQSEVKGPDTLSLVLFFLFFFFFPPHSRHMEVLRPEIKSNCRWNLFHSCNNGRSLTLCTGPGIKPVLPQRQCWFATAGSPKLCSFFQNFFVYSASLVVPYKF